MRSRRVRGRALAFVTAISLVASGCALSGTYEPRPSHRIARVGANEHTFVRDGQRFELGLTGDAVPLVRGNELAELHARKYRHNQITGLVLYGIGLGALGTSIGLFASEPRGGTRGVGGTALLASSLIVMLASTPFIFEARTSLIDAVNIYNDSLDASVGAAAPGTNPPGSW